MKNTRTKDPVRLVENYNVLYGFSGHEKEDRHIKSAIAIFERLVNSGYERSTAIAVIKSTFLIDLTPHVQ